MITVLASLTFILSLFECNMDALWDKEAFKKGSSNHLFKSLRIISWGIIAGFVSLITYNCGLLYFEIWRMFLVLICTILIYPFTREFVFDYALDFYRETKKEFSKRENSIKIFSLIFVFALIGIIHKLTS